LKNEKRGKTAKVRLFFQLLGVLLKLGKVNYTNDEKQFKKHGMMGKTILPG